MTSWFNTLSFGETYADRIVVVRDEGAVSHEPIPTSSFSARGKSILTAEKSVLPPNEQTTLSITIGGWSFEAALGDDR